MKLSKFKFIILTILALTGFRSAEAITPSPPTYFKVFNTGSGLPDNSVNCIAEDRYGLIWAGTWNGLARLDGKSVTSFQSSGDERSLSNNMIRSVHPVSYGVWAGTDSGIDLFRFSDCKFYHGYVQTQGSKFVKLKSRISRIFENDKMLFIISGGAIYRLVGLKNASEKGDFYLFKRLPKPQTRNYTDLTRYRDGRIMALSDEGITILSPNGERELYHNSIAMKLDHNQNILFDPRTNRVYTGAGIGSGMRTFAATDRNGKLQPADGPDIKGLMRATRNGNELLFATDGNGLYRKVGNSEMIHYIPTNSTSIPTDALYTVFVDSHKNIWCGSYRHGLFLASKELNSYTLGTQKSGNVSYDIVTAIAPYGDKLILGLDGGGIDFYDIASGKSENYGEASGLPGNNIVSLIREGDSLWGLDYLGGLFQMQLPSRSVTCYSGKEFPGGAISRYWILADTHDGNIWVGAEGLFVFNKQSQTYRRVEGTAGLNISSIIHDGNHLWIATNRSGVLKVNKNTLHIEERFSDSPTPGGVKIPGYTTPFIFLDSRRLLWINIGNRQLVTIDLAHGNKMKSYGKDNGLTNTHICSMVETPDGNIWIGTDGGLFKYIRSQNSFILRKDSRLPITYTPNSALIYKGNVYMGSTQGLLSFPADNRSHANTTQNTVFTGIRILDGKSTEIPLYSANRTEVNLEPGQNFFTVEFSVPSFSSPENMIFECRLEGLEDTWRESTGTNSVTYTNVPAGHYTLLVRHTNPDGTWSEPVELEINVSHHWYSSPLMIILWILIAVAVIYFLLRLWYRLISNEQKTRMVEIEHDSENKLNEAKFNFYTSITHELRTPCFLISAQIEEIQDSGRQSVPVSWLSGIYRNSQKLNKLISHIIDFRKSDTGHLKLNICNIELVSYLESLTSEYKQLCRQKSQSFTFVHNTQPIEIAADPDRIEQIVSNLVSNAYKYTPTGGKVTLTLRDLGQTVSICVADNGIGIIDKLQSAIFRPFYRTQRGENQSDGDGIGLSFVKTLVELHNGKITLESKVNEGSCFTVTLPKNQNRVATQEVVVSAAPARKPLPDPATPADTPAADKVHNPTATRYLLITDNDQGVREVVRHTFEGDYVVKSADNGDDAFELAKDGNFDVVITDLMMPGLDGRQLIKRLRENKASENTKIVVLSSVTSEEEVLSAYDKGADIVLTKPISLKVLKRKVDKLFEKTPGSSIPTKTPGTYNREEQKFLLECRRIIDENLTNENFGIEMLAAKLAMSHSSLYKKIRRMTGSSLIDFINEYRIYKAVGYFRDGNTNVQRVAEMCGFRDIKTFRETFKRKMDMPPKQYIQKLNTPAEPQQ